MMYNNQVQRQWVRSGTMTESDENDITIINEGDDSHSDSDAHFSPEFHITSGAPPSSTCTVDSGSYHALNKAYTDLKKRYNTLEQKHKSLKKAVVEMRRQWPSSNNPFGMGSVRGPPSDPFPESMLGPGSAPVPGHNRTVLLETELRKLKMEQKHYAEENLSLKAKLNDTEQQRHMLKETVFSLQKQIEQLRQRSEIFEEECRQLKEQYINLETEHEELDKSHKDIEEKYNDMKLRLSRTQADVEKHRDMYEAADEELEILRQRSGQKITSRGDTSMEDVTNSNIKELESLKMQVLTYQGEMGTMKHLVKEQGQVIKSMLRGPARKSSGPSCSLPAKLKIVEKIPEMNEDRSPCPGASLKDLEFTDNPAYNIPATKYMYGSKVDTLIQRVDDVVLSPKAQSKSPIFTTKFPASPTSPLTGHTTNTSNIPSPGQIIQTGSSCDRYNFKEEQEDIGAGNSSRDGTEPESIKHRYSTGEQLDTLIPVGANPDESMYNNSVDLYGGENKMPTFLKPNNIYSKSQTMDSSDGKIITTEAAGFIHGRSAPSDLMYTHHSPSRSPPDAGQMNTCPMCNLDFPQIKVADFQQHVLECFNSADSIKQQSMIQERPTTQGAESYPQTKVVHSRLGENRYRVTANQFPRPINIERNDHCEITTDSRNNTQVNINMNITPQSSGTTVTNNVNRSSISVLKNDAQVGQKPVPQYNLYDGSSANVADQDKQNQQQERICPVCNRNFPLSYDFEDFQSHVLDCSSQSTENTERICPMCQRKFGTHVPEQEFLEHVDSHFETPTGFEVV